MKKNSFKRYISVILVVFISAYSALGLFGMGLNTSKAAYVGYSDDIARY